MIRKTLRPLATTLSLLILTALLATDVRSHRVGDYVSVTRNTPTPEAFHSRSLAVVTGPGEILLSATHTRVLGDHPNYGTGIQFKYSPQPLGSLIDLGWDRTFLTRRGFLTSSWTSRAFSNEKTQTHLAFPLWVVMIPFTLPPIFHLLRWRKRRARRRRGQCPDCAYDVRASPDRCPECGHDLSAVARPTLVRTWLPRVALATACLTLAALIIFAAPYVEPLTIVEGPLIFGPPGTRPAPGAAPNRPAVSRIRVEITPRHREFARQIDPTRTYVFVTRVDARPARPPIAQVYLFARRSARWHSTIRYLKPGQPIGDADFPSDLTLQEVRPAGDDASDTLVLLATPAGQTVTHSTKADSADPLRSFLTEMTSYSGQFMERELFPRP